MNLGSTLSDIWQRFQGELFPALAEEVGPLLETHKRSARKWGLISSSNSPKAAMKSSIGRRRRAPQPGSASCSPIEPGPLIVGLEIAKKVEKSGCKRPGYHPFVLQNQIRCR